jgi:hypothetical protein
VSPGQGCGLMIQRSWAITITIDKIKVFPIFHPMIFEHFLAMTIPMAISMTFFNSAV